MLVIDYNMVCIVFFCLLTLVLIPFKFVHIFKLLSSAYLHLSIRVVFRLSSFKDFFLLKTLKMTFGVYCACTFIVGSPIPPTVPPHRHSTASTLKTERENAKQKKKKKR